jgi:hypothetical protein
MRKQILTLIGALLLGISVIWAQTAQSPAASNQKYTCVMHPEVVMDHPGNCPKCGMTLVPKKETEKPHAGEMHDMAAMGTYRIFGADGVPFGGMMDKPADANNALRIPALFQQAADVWDAQPKPIPIPRRVPQLWWRPRTASPVNS